MIFGSYIAGACIDDTLKGNIFLLSRKMTVPANYGTEYRAIELRYEIQTQFFDVMFDFNSLIHTSRWLITGIELGIDHVDFKISLVTNFVS